MSHSGLICILLILLQKVSFELVLASSGRGGLTSSYLVFSTDLGYETSHHP